ncbi:hypothetical protein N7481_000327 [Penicillium waksmanii]|uniref:uncharacterized protein n=1 Tax=Penicillium waksmanii TaxID=69791 RepID=UPI002548A650|nr:uncharacterized protein N7481_000327 [Penicillium waksmanii]KAJ5999918.1 hypothetical protein N7481_000327 [Penicillium waksmanii]
MDMATLLTSQRVCHMWADLIRGSKTLQQDLYFLPSSHEGNDEPRYRNPLLAEKFPFLKQLVNLNNDQNAGFWNWRPWGHEWEDIKLRNLDLLRSPSKQEQYIRPEASWRRMLTHQPPLYTVGRFSGRAGRAGSFWSQSKAAEQSNGLQMEALFYWVVSPLFDGTEESEISIYIGKGLSTDIKQRVVGATDQRCQMSDELDRMVREFDIVLAWRFPWPGCMDSDSDDEEVDVPLTEDEIILEQLYGVYQEMTRTLYGLEFETYNKGEDHCLPD